MTDRVSNANLPGVSDLIQRWMTPEGSFRILAARSTRAVADGVSTTDAAPEVIDLFGRLLTGSVLLQLAQSPASRMQFDLIHDGTAGDLLADVRPGPVVRGRMQNPKPDGQPILGTTGVIKVARRSPGQQELYRSQTPFSGGSVSSALQHYMLESEQVLSVFGLVTVVDDDQTVQRAGGMLVQGLPGWTHEELAEVTTCLERASFEDLVRAGDDPIDAVAALLAPLSVHAIGTDPLEYRCQCSMQSAVGAVMLLSEAELAEVRAGKGETVTCEFCGTEYLVTGAELEA